MRIRYWLILSVFAFFHAAGMAVAEEQSDVAAAEVVQDQPDAEHGKQIFSTICSHCHQLSHEASAVGAPGLMDVMERHDEAWVNEWLQGPEAFSKRDETARALVESNPFGLIMPTFPEMQDEKNRRDVIAFLKTLKSE